MWSNVLIGVYGSRARFTDVLNGMTGHEKGPPRRAAKATTRGPGSETPGSQPDRSELHHGLPCTTRTVAPRASDGSAPAAPAAPGEDATCRSGRLTGRWWGSRLPLMSVPVLPVAGSPLADSEHDRG